MEEQNFKRAKVEIKKCSQRLLSGNKAQASTFHPCLPPVAGITTHLTITSPIASALPLPQTALPASANETMEQFDLIYLPKTKIIISLRVLLQPTTLCGEDDAMRLLRWKMLLKAGAINMTRAELIMHGNFLYPLSVGAMERSRLPQFSSCNKQVRGRAHCDVRADDPDYMDVANILALDTNAEHERMMLTFDTLCNEYKIMVFFKQLLREWGSELEKRPTSDKSTSKGHSNLATYKESVQMMAPLLKMCKEKNVPADIKQPMLIIVQRCLERDYLSAIDEYTKLVFARVPPPQENTMVEIQEHLRMDNELMSGEETLLRVENETSKYLQCVRRLMTLCQRRYPWRPSSLPEPDSAKNGTITTSEACMFVEQCMRSWKDGVIKI